MAQSQMGVVGLAVMGENLALNIESKGFRVSVFNRTTSKTEKLVEGRAKGKNVFGAKTREEFVDSLEKPRRMILLVKAGAAVDAMIEQMRPLLEPGDIIIDGGNSHFPDTERRQKELEPDGILYIGSGVSGGETGALMGPCIMPGGPEEAYHAVEPVLTKIAAQIPDGACCAYIGPRGAGHYVKMVHNGIEYGMMELIGEVYWILSRVCGMAPADIGKVFGEWTAAELGGYLMEISTEILGRTDPDTGKPIVDIILDKAGQKGTGKWTSQSALDIGCPVPTIDVAVSARILSAYKDERVRAADVLKGPTGKADATKELLDDLRAALYAAVIIDYAQGMALLRAASAEYEYNLDFAEIARIWKGGCIIRSKLLTPIQSAFAKSPDLANLTIDDEFSGVLAEREGALRRTVARAVEWGVAVPGLASAVAYYDGYRSARVPANMTQAQRDYFGAHTYRRLDKEGTYHTVWEEHE